MSKEQENIRKRYEEIFRNKYLSDVAQSELFAFPELSPLDQLSVIRARGLKHGRPDSLPDRITPAAPEINPLKKFEDISNKKRRAIIDSYKKADT